MDSFGHAHEPQAFGAFHARYIKSHSSITYLKLDFSGLPLQVHLEKRFPTMLCRIVKRFLNHSE
jgi:hypothetical protein